MKYVTGDNVSAVDRAYINTLAMSLMTKIDLEESSRIRTMSEYGHSRYLRNHKAYKKCLINKLFINYKLLKNPIHNYINSLKKYFLFF